MTNFEVKTWKNALSTYAPLLVFFFVGPMMMMFGWNAIAWEINLPAFDYLQMFCMCNGLHWFVKGFRK